MKADICDGCSTCLRLGCPAIARMDGKAVIEPGLCVGPACGVCQQVCPLDAIVEQSAVSEQSSEAGSSGLDEQDRLRAGGCWGPGIVLMSDLLAETGMAAGYDVKKSDVFGMAQRGGSVVSYVRFGERVHSPLPPRGEVDVLVALEKLEAARWASHLVGWRRRRGQRPRHVPSFGERGRRSVPDR